MVACSWGGCGPDCQQAQGNLGGDKSILKLGCGNGPTAVYIYKNHLPVCLQWVNCMVCKLHLNESVKNKVVAKLSFEEDSMSLSPRVQKDSIHSANNARSEL